MGTCHLVGNPSRNWKVKDTLLEPHERVQVYWQRWQAMVEDKRISARMFFLHDAGQFTSHSLGLSSFVQTAPRRRQHLCVCR